MTPSDRERVRELLGREPRGRYEIVVRTDAGDPVVLRNDPLLDDGTPMPTRYWLIGPDEIRRIGQIESTGGVDEAEAAVDPDELAAAHARYAEERDAAIPADHVGPRPSGGVGGTRIGVKCLHAHWAWHLAGGDDPIGRWIAERLERPSTTPGGARVGPAHCELEIGADRTTVRYRAVTHEIPWGVDNLSLRWFADDDPPKPDALTNALGTIIDHIDDLMRLHPEVLDVTDWRFTGPIVDTVAAVELGEPAAGRELNFARSAGEEVFRLVATEARSDRAHNPGLPLSDVDTIVAGCCIIQASMRRLRLDSITLRAG